MKTKVISEYKNIKKLDMGILNEYSREVLGFRKSGNSEYNKITLCLHNNLSDTVHEMVNIYPKGLYVRPHLHERKIETKHVMKGTMRVFLYDNFGKVQETFIMSSNIRINQCSIFRITENIYHSIIPLSEVVIFHEILSGPYNGIDDNTFPLWAPINEDKVSQKEFLSKLNMEWD